MGSGNFSRVCLTCFNGIACIFCVLHTISIVVGNFIVEFLVFMPSLISESNLSSWLLSYQKLECFLEYYWEDKSQVSLHFSSVSWCSLIFLWFLILFSSLEIQFFIYFITFFSFCFFILVDGDASHSSPLLAPGHWRGRKLHPTGLAWHLSAPHGPGLYSVDQEHFFSFLAIDLCILFSLVQSALYVAEIPYISDRRIILVSIAVKGYWIFLHSVAPYLSMMF